MSLETRRFVNQSQPQTLQIAVFLLYFDAVFGLLDVLRLMGRLTSLGPFYLLVLLAPLAGGLAAYGIANEKKSAYWLGVGVSVVSLLPYAFALVLGVNILVGTGVIGLMFAIGQLALLLHPMSRDYQRTWFR